MRTLLRTVNFCSCNVISAAPERSRCASAGAKVQRRIAARSNVNARIRIESYGRPCGLVGSQRMNQFLQKLLKRFRFEDMKIPLGVVATDLAAGAPVFFRGSGDVLNPIRASCSYPGLFQPLLHEGRLLVDGAMSMEIPSP